MRTPGGTFNYTYDGDGRPSSVVNSFGETTTWSYLNNSWLFSQNVANSSNAIAQTTYYYYPNGLLSGLINQNPQGTINSKYYSLGYDGAGDLQTEYISQPAFSNNTQTTSYTYNNQDEMTDESSTKNGGYNIPFTFDNAENILTVAGGSNTLNSDDEEVSQGNVAYDGNGNPTLWYALPLVYDSENHLVSGTGRLGSALVYTFGANGLRSSISYSTGAWYDLYDGDSDLPVCELNQNGGVILTNTFGANGLVSVNASGASTFFQYDPQGSVAEGLNSQGGITESGMCTASGAMTTTPLTGYLYGYHAQQGSTYDSSTGDYLMGHRYYDETQYRFLNRDPIGYDGGVNLYDYCGNNPVTKDDPSGYGFGEDIDNLLFNGSIQAWGEAQGEADSGCASGWYVAGKAALAIGAVGSYFVPGGEEAEVGLQGAEDIGRLAESTETATEIRNACNGGSRIALGIDQYLDTFAEQIGGQTWKSWGTENFNSQFLSVVSDSDNEVFFNLEGIDNPWAAAQRGASGVKTSVTDWELSQIYANLSTWGGEVNWYLGGEAVSNPFL